ncbi:acyltransferase [Pseudomonas sp.]|uniref:acyltransferase family protein n=1 Tax=Pseudomonas sp. TaxID=306 RepID=UPI0027360FE1|nr:acyltransferase [Pseudomonas sp.]MDP3813683.1 acyltransferase [Pseudomonas sp.]
MKSSSGHHFVALDHIRALAALLVFTWHFIHAGRSGYPVPHEAFVSVFAFPLAIFDEGHVGVALFMTLSGYLFAKILDGKSIDYGSFLWNRFLRLAPLLVLVIAVVGLQRSLEGESIWTFMTTMMTGIVMPVWPNGGWSITVELHFYFSLPFLLFLIRRVWWAALLLVCVAIALRISIYIQSGEVQPAAYWTIIGRIDQFVLGMLAFHARLHLAGHHFRAISAITLFLVFYWGFSYAGGFHGMPSYPSPSAIWIILPTIEGLACAIAIAWYDGSFTPSRTGVSGLIGHVGQCSYSIYLLHVFVVYEAAWLVNERVMDISTLYPALGWAFLCFVALLPVAMLSFRFVERPFLLLRRNYVGVPDQPITSKVFS